MIIGYARTSTVEQIAGLEAQLRELKSAKCTKIFHEQVSSVATRMQLEAALEFARDGDVIVVTKLDRLARSVADLMAIIQALEQKAVGLRNSQFRDGHTNSDRQTHADRLGWDCPVRT